MSPGVGPPVVGVLASEPVISAPAMGLPGDVGAKAALFTKKV